MRIGAAGSGTFTAQEPPLTFQNVPLTHLTKKVWALYRERGRFVSVVFNLIPSPSNIIRYAKPI